MSRLVAVALPLPFQAPFSYRVPEAMPLPERGARVLVPFGSRRVVGVVLVDQQIAQTTFTEVRLAWLADPAAETKGKAQRALVDRLRDAGAALPVPDLVRDHPSWRSSLEALVTRGVVRITTERRERS